jgi:autotransporter family porin
MASLSFPRRPLARAVGLALVAVWVAPQVCAQTMLVDDGTTKTAVGTYSTSADDADALVAMNGGSRIEGTGVSVTTTGASAFGVWADSGASVDLSNSTILTSGANSLGVFASLGGDVTLRNSRVETFANGSFGVRSGGSTDLVALIDTDVVTHGVVLASVWSTGGVVSVTRGTVVSDQGSALRAQSSGIVNMTGSDLRAGGAQVIHALADGDITINGGTVTATSATGRGLVARDAGSTITATNGVAITTAGGTGADVSAGAALVFGTANVQVIGAGTAGVMVTGLGTTFDSTGAYISSAQSTGVRLIDGGVATLTDTTIAAADNAITLTSATVDNSTLNVSGGQLHSAGSSIVAQTGVHSLTVANGAQLQANNNTLVEVLDGASLSTVFDGVDLAGALTAAPTGTLDLSMQNNTAFNGTITHGGTTWVDGASAWMLSGDSDVQSLALAGTLGFAEPGGGVFKTLTVHGDYAGNGGTLSLNTHLAADDAGTDRLVVEGNTSGTTNVQITNAGGAGVHTTADGIQVVRVDGTSAGTFALAGRAVGGAFEYSLHHGGVADPNDGDWYLRSSLTPETPVDPEPPVDPGTPIDPEPPVDPGTPIVPPVPVYRPETGVYLANQAIATRMFQHRHDDRGRLRRDGDALERDAWVRVTRGQFDATAGAGQIDIGAEQHGMEIGSQFHAWGVGMGTIAVGAILNKASADTHDVSLPTQYRATGEVRGNAATLFGTWVQDASERGGLSVDAWMQRAAYEHEVRGQGLARESYDASAWTASLEGAYSLPIHKSDSIALYLQPQLQLLHTDYDADTHVEANGTVVAPHGDGGLTTRLGVRLFGIAKEVQPFAELNAWHNDTGNAIRFDDQVVDLALDKVVYEANVGLTVDFGKGWAGWGSMGVQHASSSNDIRGQIGLKYRW